MPDARLKLAVERVDLSPCLHTALRKCCDSPPTTLAYNLIHMDAINDAWGEWLDAFWKLVGLWKESNPSENLTRHSLEGLCHESVEHLGYGDPARNCLRITFSMFSQGEWMAMLHYAFEEDKDVTENVSTDDGTADGGPDVAGEDPIHYEAGG